MKSAGSANSRFNELDLLRFAAAVAVVLYHWTFRGAASDGLSTFSIPAFLPWVKYGYLGVDFFFILSGFVILLSIQGKGPIEFAISRFTRLYPAFWTCCSLTFIACLMAKDEHFPVTVPQYIANMTMFNFYIGQENIDGVYWTLMEEMKFYAFVFLLLCCRQSHRIEAFLRAWLVVSVVCLLTHNRWVTFLISAKWSGHFIAGATYFLIHRYGLTPRRLLLLLGCVVYSTWHSAQSAQTMTDHYHTSFDPFVIAGLVLSFHGLFFLVSQGWTQFSTKAFRLAGNLTYPLYLLHQNIGYLLLDRLDGKAHPGWVLTGVTVVMLFAAWLVYYVVERNVNHRLKRWLEDRLVRPNRAPAVEPVVLTFPKVESVVLAEQHVRLSDTDNIPRPT